MRSFFYLRILLLKKKLLSCRPSKALRYEHVQWNLSFRDHQWHQAKDALAQYEVSAAACVEIFSWLGWLRGGEVFGLDFDSVLLVPPAQGPSHGLPRGVGYLALVLAESTKSSPTLQADVILAWMTAGGIPAGRWFTRLEHVLAALGWNDSGPLFRHRDGSTWDSYYFRHTHLYPLLQLQRAAGDPTLSLCSNTKGNTIEELYYSMHMYRRGGTNPCGAWPSVLSPQGDTPGGVGTRSVAPQRRPKHASPL